VILHHIQALSANISSVKGHVLSDITEKLADKHKNLLTQKEHLPKLKTSSKQRLKNKAKTTLHC